LQTASHVLKKVYITAHVAVLSLSMIYFSFAGIAVFSLIYLSLPFIRGSRFGKYFNDLDERINLKENQEQNIKDKIESAKLALRDLDMENKIGKIANEDYNVLKDELLDEWNSAESEYKQVKK